MFKKSVEEFIPYLTKNGEIMVGYLYLMLGCSIDEPIFRKELRDQVFSTNYHYVSFTSISELEKKFKNNLVIPYSKDVCMVLKKD